MVDDISRRKFLTKFVTASSVSGLSGCGDFSGIWTSKLRSPDKSILLRLKLYDNNLVYTISAFGKQIVEESRLNLSLDRGNLFPDNPSIITAERESVRTEREGIWNTNKKIKNEYNRLRLIIGEDGRDKFELIFRLYNLGVAFRYKLLNIDDFQDQAITRDKTEFSVANDCQVWFPTAWGSRIEGPTHPSNLSAASTPLTLQFDGDIQYYLSIHEAALRNSASMRVSSIEETRLRADLASEVDIQLPYLTPWRVIIVAKELGSLSEQNLITNLNEPRLIDDTSWISPGKSVWDWRVRGDSVDGYTYELNDESLRRLIDFASRNSIQFITVDAGWYGDEHNPESNPMEATEVNIQGIIEYGRSKGVGTILYINDIAFDTYEIEQILDTYREWRAAGIKHGFLSSATQDSVKRVERLLNETAHRQLHYLLHEAYKPTGVHRTWPHFLTQEYVQSLADGPREMYAAPEYFTLLPFVNMIGGAPLDATPGFFSLDEDESRDNIRGQVKSTIVGQLARCILVRTGLLTLPDTPEAYEELQELFEFVQEIPSMKWDDSVVVDAELGEFVIIARKSGDDWFVGGVTNSDSRKILLELDFLEEGQYATRLYVDGSDAHYRHRPKKYDVKNRIFRSTESVPIQFAPGGGVALILRSKK